MSPHLPAVTARDVARVASTLGFTFRRQRGSHAIYRRESDKRRLIIPMHAGAVLKPKTLLGILSEMGISVDEFRLLL